MTCLHLWDIVFKVLFPFAYWSIMP